MTLLKASKVGDYFTVENQDGHRLFVRTIDSAPDIIHTEGSDAIDKAYTIVMAKFRNVQSWGICSCRNIGSTGTISQHAYCNAWDLHSSPEQMEQIFHFFIDEREMLHTHTAIYNHRVWSRENPTIHPYITPPGGSDHEDHVHFDPDPQSPGSPC